MIVFKIFYVEKQLIIFRKFHLLQALKKTKKNRPKINLNGGPFIIFTK